MSAPPCSGDRGDADEVGYNGGLQVPTQVHQRDQPPLLNGDAGGSEGGGDAAVGQVRARSQSAEDPPVK